MRYVIIGGDAAGMSAASRLKRLQPESEVLVLEKTEDVSYSACGMPYNIADTDSPITNLVVRAADAFRNDQGIDLRTGYKVEKINRKDKIVSGKISDGSLFEILYDKLMIATGARAVHPDVPGADLAGVFVLKTLENGRQIKSFISEQNPQSAVIVGMGYIALEMAEALSIRGISVTMIKSRPQLLPWMLPELSAVVGKELEQNGVGVFPGLSLELIEKKDTGLCVHAGGRTFDCGMVLFATGVEPAAELAASAGLELGASGAVSVDTAMTTSDPDIFSAGDCADCLHVVSGRKVWIPLALTANRGGRLAADAMLGKSPSFPGIAGTGVFKVFNLEVARTGLNMNEAENAGFTPVCRVTVAKSRAHVYKNAASISLSLIADKTSGKILGAQMVGAEGVARRINAVAVALQAGMTLDDFYTCDFAYAPPFSPVWDPLLTAASLLQKKID